MKSSRVVLLLLVFAVSVPVLAQEPLVFDNQHQQDQFDRLTKELRCLVCQNQNLADSDAQLAHDLRREVHDLILTGRNDEEVKQFLVDRYGDFVLYRPPLQTNTYLLWVAPLILLLIGAWVLRASVSKRSALLDEGEQKDLNN